MQKRVCFFSRGDETRTLYFVFCLQGKKLLETSNSLVPIGLTFSFSLPERFGDWVGAFFYGRTLFYIQEQRLISMLTRPCQVYCLSPVYIDVLPTLPSPVSKSGKVKTLLTTTMIPVVISIKIDSGNPHISERHHWPSRRGSRSR